MKPKVIDELKEEIFKIYPITIIKSVTIESKVYNIFMNLVNTTTYGLARKYFLAFIDYTGKNDYKYIEDLGDDVKKRYVTPPRAFPENWYKNKEEDLIILKDLIYKAWSIYINPQSSAYLRSDVHNWSDYYNNPDNKWYRKGLLHYITRIHKKDISTRFYIWRLDNSRKIYEINYIRERRGGILDITIVSMLHEMEYEVELERIMRNVYSDMFLGKRTILEIELPTHVKNGKIEYDMTVLNTKQLDHFDIHYSDSDIKLVPTLLIDQVHTILKLRVMEGYEGSLGAIPSDKTRLVMALYNYDTDKRTGEVAGFMMIKKYDSYDNELNLEIQEKSDYYIITSLTVNPKYRGVGTMLLNFYFEKIKDPVIIQSKSASDRSTYFLSRYFETKKIDHTKKYHSVYEKIDHTKKYHSVYEKHKRTFKVKFSYIFYT